MYLYIYTEIDMHMHVYIYIYISIYKSISIYIYICTSIWMHIHVSYMYIDVHIQRESADTYQDHIHQGQTCIINRKHRVNYQTNLMSRGARARYFFPHEMASTTRPYVGSFRLRQGRSDVEFVWPMCVYNCL